MPTAGKNISKTWSYSLKAFSLILFNILYVSRSRHRVIPVMKLISRFACKRFTEIKTWEKVKFQNQMQKDSGHTCNWTE